MAGLVGSIFGKTVQELQQERIAERKQAIADAMRAAQQQGGNTGAAALGSLFGSMLGEKIFGGEAMEKAREAEEKQAALNAQLSELDRTDPKRFYLQSDAYNKAGDLKTATDYLRLGQEIEFKQEQFKKDKAEKDATRAAELEKRKTLSEAYPNNEQAQKMALSGFTVDQIEKISGAKKPKAFIAEATKDDIDQVSSFFAMNDLNFGEETQPVVVRMLAEDLSRLKNDYSKAFEEGDLEKPWAGDTQAINGLLAEYQARGYITNEPSTFGVGGGLRFNPTGQNLQNNQNRTGNTPLPKSAVEKTFPEGLPTNNNNVASPKQTEASLGTLGDIIGLPNKDEINKFVDTIGLPNKDEINKFKEDYFTPNWQNYLNE